MSARWDVVETSRDPFDDLVPGTVVDGKYKVDRVVGRGGMGIVVRAQHLELGEAVALKFLRIANDEAEGDFRARFALEARVCAKLRNEHIARVRDVGQWREDIPYMVMEYLEGMDLKRAMRGNARVPLDRAVGIVVQICEGLAEAHADGIIHRDLKPQNVFLTKRRSGAELVKVLDFGISKWTSGVEGQSELTKAGMMLGSPKYMSPEQLSGDTVSQQSDVWAIGALLYTMLTGRAPFDYAQVTQTFMAIASGARPTLPSEIEPTVPAALDAVILRCLTRDRTQRVADVADLAGDVLEAVESPFAAQARASIRAVLTHQAPVMDPLSMTTGKHAVFSLAEAATSLTPGALFAPTSLAPTMAPPAPRPWKRALAAGAGAMAVLALAGFARTPDAPPASSAASAVTRASTQRTFAPDAPTVLLEPAVAQIPDAPRVYAPVARAVAAGRAVAHKPADAGATAPVVSAPPAASPAPTPSPRRAEPSAAASANALDDRQ